MMRYFRYIKGNLIFITTYPPKIKLLVLVQEEKNKNKKPKNI
jgi:hypothetical protein